MAIYEIPLPTDAPLFTVRADLDGTDYDLRFDWSGRENRWTFSLYLPAGDPIARGLRVVPNWNVLRATQTPGRPPGQIWFLDERGRATEAPGFSDLGRRVRLHYIPAADL